jgi:ADP-dependent NAD(P)H-hydrate dehydratase / NAD(P)H-hydrate epimerase
MYLVTAKEMQEMDRKTIESFGIPGMVLMENAARGAVEALLSRIDGKKIKKIAVLAGRGNNGGDGFVMARYLMEKGFKINVFLLASKEGVKGDAAANLKLFETLCEHSDTGSLIEIPSQEEFNNFKLKILHHDLFIDALLGTGLNAEVRGIMKSAIELMNASAKPVFSVDIPSGLSADTGQVLGTAVKAFATATFAFAKIGHILHPGNSLTNSLIGELEIIDIGIPKYIADTSAVSLSLIEKENIAALFPSRAFDTHKGHLGHLLIIAGSSGKTGAAALCANAAMRSGTGLVTVGVPESLNPVMEGLILEAMTYPLPEEEKGLLTQSCFGDIQELIKGKQVLALGPGLGTHPGTKRLVEKLVSTCELPMIIDADGLNHIAKNPDILKQKKASIILTPHPGEMARLCSLSTKEIQADRIGTARQFAAEFKVILILKGAGTVIVLPGGNTFISPTGNAGMASGGMGDVLTGMIAGFCAQGLSPENASLAGVYLHGLCADILAEKVGRFGFLASDLVRTIPESQKRIFD